MARKISPFAELTSEEKQIKWMEYQSIRLPYTQVMETKSEKHEDSPKDETNDISQVSSSETSKYNNATIASSSRPSPPPEVFVSQGMKPHPSPVSSYQQINEYQKSRHRQYDAVIERMKQAEKRVHGFCDWSK